MMMKEGRMKAGMMVMVAVLISFSFVVFPGVVTAKSTPIKGMNYNANTSLLQNLKMLIGKTVQVTLSSGQTFTGTIKAVGNNLVHLEKLVGKEYYDALIRIETIEAIDSRFRNP